MTTETTRPSGARPGEATGVASGDVSAPASVEGRPGEAGAPLVTVRYWAAARAAAGVDRDDQPGGTVGAVVEAAVAAHPELARVARAATFLVDGRAAGRDTPVAAGSTVEVLPPFAGG